MSADKNDSVFSMIKLGLILAIYAAVSCTVLAVVNNFTVSKIKANQENKINLSMKEFFPEEGLTFENVTDFEKSSDSTISIEKVIIAKKDGKIAGGAVQVSGPTYDKATVLVGLNSDFTVSGVNFLEITDSPGFGSKAKDPSFKLESGETFYGQFKGKNAKDGFITNETFDAISGATITSNGVAKLLSEGTSTLIKYFEKQGE